MGFFKNLRLRRKLLIAMIPLVLMVVAAGIYSSFESKMIDTWYSELIDTPGQKRSETLARRARIRIGSDFSYLNWLTRPIRIAGR